MARNAIQRAIKRLLAQAKKMSKGIMNIGSSVPITMVSQGSFDKATGGYESAEDVVKVKRTALTGAQTAFAPARAAVYDFLNAARPVFVSYFGYRWNGNWAQAGWINPTTRIPRALDDQIELVNSIAKFLTANPSYEVSGSGVTAANAAAIYTSASQLQGAMKTAESDLETAETARNTTQMTLVSQMQLLIKNLSLLGKGDPRWKQFGLNVPASKTTPDKPTGLMARMDEATGKMMLTCDPQPLGERFRFRGRNAGSTAKFTLMASSDQPMALVAPLALGIEMELMVQAVNGGAQSVPSDSIFFTVPAAPTNGDALVKPTATAKPTPLLAPAPKANGKTNGKTNGKSELATSRLS